MTTPGRRSTLETYRDVIGLTGPLLPVVSFLGRLPTATIQFGSVLLVARTSDSLAAAGLTGGALALGQVSCGPLVGRLADRHGQRTVVLLFASANALAVTALVAGALAGLNTPVLALLGAGAGATVPLIGPLARARLVALARRAAVPDATVGAALSFESTLDEISFVLGPALVGVASVLAHPAYALGGAAVLVAVCGTGFALHPTATATRPGTANGPGSAHGSATEDGSATEGGSATEHGPGSAHGLATEGAPGPVGGHPPATRARAVRGAGDGRPGMPRSVHALRAALALQGAMFGACQAGITALTGQLGQEDQAGLVYAAMGVMSAVAGLSMAAVPARFGLRARRRAATAAAFALSLPLLGTHTLTGLYAVVTVLGVAYAPHLVTVFGLTERVVPPSRLAEAMAYATSAIVAGQALAVAVCGRLADARGPGAAFAVASTAAGLAAVLALTARPAADAGDLASTPHARVPTDDRAGTAG
ncbi:MFS transporter [Streptomyces sp. NPDC021356]|uniref:MFS transporter n=1 Tax=Streptomyces sp. NPDC021356 TaxID=3154900 RepID=UPI0033E3ADB4